jgi:hypothetical protein
MKEKTDEAAAGARGIRCVKVWKRITRYAQFTARKKLDWRIYRHIYRSYSPSQLYEYLCERPARVAGCN